MNAQDQPIPSTADAVPASVACARSLGLPADAPVVTRVVTLGRELCPDPLSRMQRDVYLTQLLVASGVPLVTPWEDPANSSTRASRCRCGTGPINSPASVRGRFRRDAGPTARRASPLPR